MSRYDVIKAPDGYAGPKYTCDHCQREKDVLVRLGEEIGDDTMTCYVCRECLLHAVAAIDKASE